MYVSGDHFLDISAFSLYRTGDTNRNSCHNSSAYINDTSTFSGAVFAN
jgi:hypothetical protein